MDDTNKQLLTEEEYYKQKRLKKIWLALFPIFMLPGVFSFGFFLLGLIYPEAYVKDHNVALLRFTMTAFIPVMMIVIVGLVFFLLGLKRSFFQLKIGSIILLVAGISFIPYTADYFITTYKNRPIDYTELSNAELKELVEENQDNRAAVVLKTREEKTELEYYKGLNNQQLYALWKANGDLKAYDVFNRRLMRFKVERIKYTRLSGDELIKKYEKDKDQLAWFEIEARKRKLSNGGEDIFE
jgi:uncharacterized membrane protein